MWLYDPMRGYLKEFRTKDVEKMLGKDTVYVCRHSKNEDYNKDIRCYLLREKPSIQKKKAFMQNIKFEGECWKNIPGFSDYQASNEGRIRNKKTKNILLPVERKKFLVVKVKKDGYKRNIYTVGKLVWKAFRGEVPKGKMVSHISVDTLDNNINNLILVTQADMNRKRRNRKPVARIDKEGNVIEYRSIQEAAKENYLERSSITKALTGKIKTAAGCEWIYLEK